MLNINRQKNQGDTIVEALMALAIAAFAVGITYATANRSLQQAITARERNQALNLIENQITDLRIRYGGDTANFNTNFATPNHYCLDDSAATLSDPHWARYSNSSSGTEPTTLQGSGNPYNSSSPNACVRNVSGVSTSFYIDIISTDVIPGNAANVNYTVFQVFVRWQSIGGSHINQASLFFRPNGNVNQDLGYALPDALTKVYAYRGVGDVS